jgi:hypothetical protein
MEGHRAEGDWKQRLTDLALRVRDAFDAQPQLAAVWSRYASSGAGSRMVMEEVLQALRASGLPDAEIPTRYHRVAVLIAALIAAEAGSGAVTQEEHEQGMELFRVAVLGADPGRFPALARFARDVRPLGEDRRAAFDDILAAQLADIEASVGAAGMNDRNRGWSTEMHAGASTSPKMRNASSPPTPLAVIVLPAIARSSTAERGPSSLEGERGERDQRQRSAAGSRREQHARERHREEERLE